MSRVSVLRCDNYNTERIEEILNKSFENIGGLDNFIKPGDKVLLKANLLMKKRPQDAVTTHPAIVEALIKIIHKKGGIVTIADSPGGPYNIGALKGVYKACGMEEVALKTGARLNYNTEFETVTFNEGKTAKKFNIIKPVLESDVIINLPKLKTHMMTFYSGAVKNLFGTVAGLYKAEFHALYPKREDFCSMLVDLCCLVKPSISVMDAVWGMEGQGPSSGIPKKIGAVIVSDNPFALDGVACYIAGITDKEAQTVKESKERGLWTGIGKTQIVGDSIDKLKISDLIKPPIGDMSFANAKWYIKPFYSQFCRLIVARPSFNKEKCIGCGDCVRCCPVGALKLNKTPKLDKSKCISCFCCQELCPKKAVVAKRNIIIEKLIKI